MTGYEAVSKIMGEVKKAIVGKDEVIEVVMATLIADGHVLIDDIPGVGKTTLALAFSKAMSLKYSRVQFTPDVLPSDVTGFTMYNRQTCEFEYKEGPVMCNLFLADEINRTTSKTQSALLEVMEEKTVTVDSVTHRLPEVFNVIATQNPVGSVGTHMLPDSQLDRFMTCVSMGYPAVEEEVALLKAKYQNQPLKSIRPVINVKGLEIIKQDVANVYLSDEIYGYIANIALATRNNTYLSLGISPRGSVAITKAAQGMAYLNQRNYVLPEDVNRVLFPCVRHRVILNGKAKAAKMTVKEIVEKIIHEQNKGI